MIKVKDGYAKLIGTTYKGSPDWVLLSNGGHKPISDFATASGVVTALGTNGNYVTWTKNGTVNNLTVPYATKSNKLYQNEDLRNENTLPYASADYNKSISAPFLRYNSVDGLNDGGTYHTSIIITPWSDHTGGSAHNIGLTNNGNIWIRSGTTEWSNWKKIAFFDEIPTKVSQLTNDSGYLTSTNLTNYVTLNSNLTITGSKTFSTQLKFTVANGTAPFTVTSKTLVDNLNADLLDGRNSSDYIAYKNKSINYTEGWYRIAETSVNVGNNIGIFYIYSSGPGYHTNVILGASISYTSIPTLNLLNMTQYSTMSISKARIVYNNSTYAELKAYLDVYIPLTLTSSDGSAKSIQIFVKFVGHKWSLTPIEAATVENTHTTKEISFAKNTIISDYFLGDLIGSASALTTTRKIWGLNFDGTQNVTGNMNGVGTINNRLLLDGSGNAQVHITGVTANTDYIKLQIDGESNSNRNLVLLTDGGFVGIGTDSPLYKLHVAGELYVPKVNLDGLSLTKSANVLNISNSSGYILIGPQNEHHCHLYTDLPSFYTNKPILIGGKDALHTGNWSSTITKSALGLGNVQNTAFYKRVATVNGTEWGMAGTINSTAFTIYAPTTPGTSGQVLTSSGGTPTWVDYSKISNKEAYSSFTTNKGWYRVAELTTSNAVSKNNTIISIQRSYNSPQNEHYIFAISVGCNGQININQLSGCVGGLLITKVRVVYTNFGNCYFDCHIAASTYPNLYRVHVLAGDCVSYQYPQLITDTSTVRSVEVATVNGMSSNYGFTGDLSGNATTATSSRNLSKFIISTSKSPGEDNKLNWCNAASTANGDSGTAIDANGFPVSNNANGILWLGTYTGNYGGQLGISSNSNLYYRYASGGTFPNTWKQLAFTDSDITGNAASASALYRPSRLDNVDYKADKIGSFTHLLINSTIGDNFPFPSGGSSILHMEWDSLHTYSKQLAVGAEKGINKPNNRLKWRAQNDGVWCDWKTVAFTDSNVASATITGDSTMTIIPLLSNEINFGGTNNSLRIYFGYRATDSKPIPTSFIFGGSDGSASLSASKFIKSGGTAALLLRADGNVATFNWSGQNGQPTWLWGGDTQHTYYVYNPANFSVNYATSSGTLKTARTINVTVGGTTGTAQSFDGSKNITIPVSGMGEAYLTWGGKNISGDISPIDAAASLLHSANKFELANPDGITIEYSTNSGSTWLEYSSTDEKKINLVGVNGSNYYYGGSSTASLAGRLRITLNATSMGVYTALKKLLINFSTCGSSGCTVTMETSKKGSETTFSTVGTYSVSGWSGWNSIPCGFAFGGSSNQTGNTAIIRLTFSHTALGSSLTLNPYVININAIGTSNWATPSTIARTGHLYSYDYLGNATFPKNIITSGKITASEGFVGNASTATLASTVTVGTGSSNTYRAIVVHNGNSLYSAGNKVLYNYSTGDVKATSFTGKLNGSLVGGAKGNIVYQSATDTTAFLANPSTNGYVLKFNTSTGLPYWASDNNTAYSAMSLTEANVGTKTIPRVITASVLHTKILNQIITSIGYESTGGIEKSGNYISGGGQNIVSALFELDETIKNNIYTLPLAASGTRGGILIGYSESGKNYAVKLSSEKAYVYVPWTDTKVNVTLATTTKAYLLGVSTTPTSTALTLTTVSDTGVYLDTTAGSLTAINFKGHLIGTISGSYTANGGQQNPNYFGKNKVGFLMMNTTVNNNSSCKDWMIMDCYSGSDVGGAVAFGVNRQALGAYIMRSTSERTSWTESAELLGTHNYSNYALALSGGTLSGDLTLLNLYVNYMITSSKPSGALYNPWSIHMDDYLWIQSATANGTNVKGKIALSGKGAESLTELFLKADLTKIHNTILFNKLSVPTTSGGSTYGPGSNGQVLKSNGSTVYWANDNNSYGYIGTTAVQSSSKAQSLTGIINITASGNIIASGEITAYSDRRLKSNIKPLENRGYIQPMTYIKDNKECIGFIAQDVLEKYPELVNDNNEYLSLNYLQYVAVLQALIIELEKRIKDLENGTRKL